MSELTPPTEKPYRPERRSWSERREARFQQRVEMWEERLQKPAPRKLHRTIILLIMMALMLALLSLLLTAPSPAPPAA
jgi:hypothetical protein